MNWNKRVFSTILLLAFVLCIPSFMSAQDILWEQTSGPGVLPVTCLAVSGPNLFAGIAYYPGVLLSTNEGGTWTEADSGLGDMIVNSLVVSGTNLFAGTQGDGVFRSTNNGGLWTQVDSGLTDFEIFSMAVSGTILFAGTYYGGVFLSNNNGTSWAAVDTGLANRHVRALAVSGTNLFAGTDGGGVFLSTNNGSSWAAVNAGLTNTHLWSLAASGTNIFAGTEGGLFHSSNNGTSWMYVNNGPTRTLVRGLAVIDTDIFAGTEGEGAFLSTNNGTTWTQVNCGLRQSDMYVFSLAAIGSHFIAGTAGTGLFRSPPSSTFQLTDGWNLISVPFLVSDVAKTSLFPTSISRAFAYHGRYIASDSLMSGKGYWLKFPSSQDVSLPGVPIAAETVTVTQGWNMIGSIAVPVPTDSITSIPPGIITTNFFGNNGTSYSIATAISPGKGYWVKANQNGSIILSSCPTSSQTSRIRITPTSELPPTPPSGADIKPKEVPTEFSLEQNYPDPFNPTTIIPYDLPQPSKVRLSIFNMLGEEVRTLVNQFEGAGYKSVDFDASTLPSGVYFSRLQAGNFVDVKKMIFLK